MILDKESKTMVVPGSGFASTPSAYTIIAKILIIWLGSANSGYNQGVAWPTRKIQVLIRVWLGHNPAYKLTNMIF